MPSFRKARVVEIVNRREGLTETTVDLDGEIFLAVNYDNLTGTVQPEDEVILNTTAVELGLGTGNRHFIVWNLKNGSVSIPADGHIMKLRYTPLQTNCLCVEEQGSEFHDSLHKAKSLDKMPVVIGTLHSQLPAVVATIKEVAPKTNIAYIMTDAAALPIAFSNLVHQLKNDNLLDTTITVGHAFGGDLEAINIYSGLVAAKVAAQADVAAVIMGPGIVGTHTVLGHTGIEQGQIINAVNTLEGSPIAIPRLGFRDKRHRHSGVSHHTLTALSLIALTPAIVPLPKMDEEKMELVQAQLAQSGILDKHRVEVIENNITLTALKKYGLNVTTMGRTVDEEPEFFKAAGLAGLVAVRMLKEINDTWKR
jgi:hypothetical protein